MLYGRSFFIMDEKYIYRRRIYLAVSAVAMLFAGIIYAWSILKAPLALEFNWNPQQLALNFTLTMCFFCLGGLVAGFLLKKLPAQAVLILAGVLNGIGFTVSSQIHTDKIILLYLAYGVICGSGIGIAYTSLLAVTNSWFPDKKGTSSGVQMMAFGASSLILGNLANYLMELDRFGWRKTYLLLGILSGAVLVLSSFILHFAPEDFLRSPNKAQSSSIFSGSSQNYTTSQMIHRPTFWKFFLFSLSFVAVGNTIISCAKDIALSVGAGNSLATTMVGVLAICNGLGRLIAGNVFDRLGYRSTMYIGNIITILTPLVLLLASLSSGVIIGIAGLCIAGLSYGFSPPISSAVIMEFYGQKNYAMNFSVANLMLIPSSFVATFAGKIVLTTGNYFSVYLLLLVLAVVSLLLNISIKHP